MTLIDYELQLESVPAKAFHTYFDKLGFKAILIKKKDKDTFDSLLESLQSTNLTPYHKKLINQVRKELL